MKKEDILEACRNKDKQALAKLGKYIKDEYPPQEGVTDDELIQQISSVKQDSPAYKRLVKEAYDRWGRDQQSRETQSTSTSQPDSSTNS